MILSFLLYFLLCFNSNAESFRRSYDPKRIIGGEPANIEDVPYQLLLEAIQETTNAYFHICGASIIHSSWALTAAHCIPEQYGIIVRLRAGSSFRMRDGTLHYATEVYVHPKYDSFTTDYDVAVIKVDIPFQHSDVTQRILLASKTPSSGTPAVVSGFGSLNCELETPEQLQKLTVDIIEYDKCKLNNTLFFRVLTPRMLCAASPVGGKNVFLGDSGGPLVVDNYQVGIASFGYKNNFEFFPAVYTDVSKVRQWIISITGEEYIYH